MKKKQPMNSPILVNDKQELLNHPATQVTKWWLPDDILFFTEIPKTSVGKFSKKTLLELYEASKLTGAQQVGRREIFS
ncbi:hypothetical protein V7139_08150 [Neobacillus drentensis]|uniref:hypothetical protein n=1 Tax=Neobacillus drentensis TaxID=220684 RepID=UPI002FFEFEB9